MALLCYKPVRFHKRVSRNRNSSVFAKQVSQNDAMRLVSRVLFVNVMEWTDELTSKLIELVQG